MTKIYSAPLQGYTDRVWRKAHAAIYGGVDTYFTPFIRWEKGGLRTRDIREVASHTSEGAHVVPQIIFSGAEEFDKLMSALVEAGVGEVDLNLGCPFPPQVKHGRGAGLIVNPQALAEVGQLMRDKYSDVAFSAKMRVGVSSPEEWHDALPVINDMPLRWLAVHPRVASQQYKGDLHLEQFDAIRAESVHPLIFNGDLRTLDDLRSASERYGDEVSLMIGRGLLARPSLAAEYAAGEEWDDNRRRAALADFHEALYEAYTSTLCGDAQILAKLKPFWEYLEEEIGRKPWKLIHKATTLAKYNTAVAQAL